MSIPSDGLSDLMTSAEVLSPNGQSANANERSKGPEGQSPEVRVVQRGWRSRVSYL